MSPRHAETNARMRDAARARILAASLKTFAERGFEAASMRSITERAGISKGLAYHYFSSKEELLLAVLEGELDALIAITARLDPNASARRRLADLVDGLIAHVIEHSSVFRLHVGLALRGEGNRLAVAARERLRQPLEAYLDRVRALFADLGSTDPDLDAFLFRSVLLGLCVRLAAGEPELPLEAIRDRLLALFAPNRGARGIPS